MFIRAVAVVVGLLAVLSAALVGADALLWRTPAAVVPAAATGLAAFAVGLVAAAHLWRRSMTAMAWLALWGVVAVAFIVVMPVLALRYPAPEDQTRYSLGAAAVFVAIFLPVLLGLRQRLPRAR